MRFHPLTDGLDMFGLGLPAIRVDAGIFLGEHLISAGAVPVVLNEFHATSPDRCRGMVI